MRADVARGGRGEAVGASGTTRQGVTTTTSWRGSRSPARSAVRLAGMRLTHHWQLLLAVAVGILVAVVLICTVPLYNTLVANVQLERALTGGVPTQRNVETLVQNGRVDVALREQATGQVAGLAHQYLSGYTSATPTYYVETNQMLLLHGPHYAFNPAASNTPRITFQAFDYAAAAPHMKLVQGALPQTGTAIPEALVTSEMATDQNVRVGDQLVVTQFGDHSRTLTVRVAGIWQPESLSDPYWNGLSFEAHSGQDNPDNYPVQLSSDVFFAQLAPFDQVTMAQHWVYYTEPSAISIGTMDTVRDRLASLRAHMNGDVLPQSGVIGVGVVTALDATIKDIESQQTLLVLPLYVIVAQIVGLALLFVTAMAGLLIEGQSQEIATLKSRGASSAQLLGTFTAQGAVLGLIAAVAGPFIAVALALALLRLFVPSADAVNQSSYLNAIAAPRAVILPAIVGALLGIGAVAFSAWQSARMDVLAFRREQGRATRQPFWRRYYLDVLLAVLCVVGYLELGQFGGLDTRQQLGTHAASPLLLVTPALLLLAGSLLVLRVFPYGAGLGARLAARGRGMTQLLAFSQVERNPSRYTRMTLLLMLAVGLGFFALTFDTSLQQNGRDRAAYETGADIRISQSAGLGNGQDVAQAQRLLKLPGVLGVTPAYRTRADATPMGQGGTQVDVLAIDPTTFGQQAGDVSWRSDYADRPLPELLDAMKASSHPDTAGSRATPVWTLVSQAFATDHHVKLGDRYIMNLAETTFSSTVFYVGDVVNDFPTMYPDRLSGSFVIADLNDYDAAIKVSATSNDYSLVGPNEFWLRTSDDPTKHAALLAALHDPELDAQKVVSRADLLATVQLNPVGSGMRGLLIVGAVTAAVLAVIGSIVQSVLATRQRATQFAVLRTIGMVGRQLTGLLLGEQIVVYVFGLVGGTVLGVLLATATLPFLQFSDTSIDPEKLGIPPYTLTFSVQGIAIFYAALLAAFAVALVIAARYAATIGLGKALRLGED